MFLSIDNSFYCSTTQKGDVREIIPEFFFLPEIFYNLNNINFGERVFSNNERTVVSDVALPIWSENNGYKFVTKLKEVLESQEVSLKISDWLDLIFGYKQRGKEAEESCNIFLPSAYGIDMNLEEMEQDARSTSLTMVEIGLVPNQICNKKIISRVSKDYVRLGKLITESNDLKLNKFIDILPIKTRSSSFSGKERRLIVNIKITYDSDALIISCVFGNNQIFTYRNDSSTVKTIDNYNYQDSLFKVQNKISDFYGETTQNCPICIYANGKVKIFFIILKF